MLTELQWKLVGAAVLALAIASLTVWAVLERAGKLSAQVELERKNTELQRAVDQVGVLALTVKAQSRSIDFLAAATTNGRRELREIMADIKRRQAGTVELVNRLELAIAGATPTRPDGSPQDCRDALTAWRREISQ